MNIAQREAYRKGAQSRRDGQGRESCAYDYSAPVMRAYWLAGWHDEDMGKASV